jgi:hypothetical protein
MPVTIAFFGAAVDPIATAAGARPYPSLSAHAPVLSREGRGSGACGPSPHVTVMKPGEVFAFSSDLDTPESIVYRHIVIKRANTDRAPRVTHSRRLARVPLTEGGDARCTPVLDGDPVTQSFT